MWFKKKEIMPIREQVISGSFNEIKRKTITILIIYRDQFLKQKIIDDVTSYAYSEGRSMFYFVKNGRHSYIPIDNVVFFGCRDDWNNNGEEKKDE